MKVKEFERRAKYQHGYDRVLTLGTSEWKIIDIHEIPSVFEDRHEVDFYCCNGQVVYLLRLRNRRIEMYDYVHRLKEKELGYPPYLIAEFPIVEITNNVLKDVLRKFDLI